MRSILVGLTILAAAGCRRSPPPPLEQRQSQPNVVELTRQGLTNAQVSWQRVAPGTFHPRIRLVGTIAGDPSHVAQVGTRAPGRVSAIRVGLGDVVRAGQVLVEVDSSELHEVTLKFLTAKARAGAAQDALARQKQLVDERVGALQDLRRSEAEAASADAALTEAHEHLHFLGLSDDQIAGIDRGAADESARSQVRSPIAGQVAALNVSLGQVLSGNETLATVADVKDIWVSVRVYERDLASVSVGAPAEVHVPTYEGRTFEGTVRFVSDVLDDKNRSAEVRVWVPNTEGALRPGMSATAFVDRRTEGSQLWLPVEALQPYEGHLVVFVRTGESRFEARTVTAGAEQGGFRPVTSGMRPDDEAVTSGAFALRAELERAGLEE